MKYFLILSLCVGCGLLSLLSLGCPFNGTQYPTTYGVPTATPAPATVSVVGAYSYFSGGVTLSSAIGMTIIHGQSVVWDTSNAAIHPLYLDNGTSCLVTNSLAFPLTQTFSTIGTYNFHCGNHGACVPSNATCPLSASSCTGLVSFIVVN
jgi:hypothetical protein